ncbi:sigma factor G inhibitor Gin [Microaerobacter geothermalis]|uniref:sigma factor G inhibitor Gin n=1 Tax=Microaerobacter geothermalis TaxID=674972 RepID=UPI001F262227|nr:sigma factor G inhibitor Gin [Microaerobacter geothermalis]MCF6095139.1 sigma factor G inhibitor Gin [Microaerobacter geothermalis]
MEQEMRYCIVCGMRKDTGISIWGEFICIACEHEIIDTDVYDEKYPFFIEQMRRIWLKNHA